MTIIDSILALLKKKGNTELDDVPAGLCPNCWGREEYGGKFYEAVKKNDTDINSKSPNVGWIQDYANKNLSGIRVEHENEQYICPTCTVGYKPA